MSNTVEESKDLLRKTMELGEKAKMAQSAVSLAAGSLDTFEEDDKKQNKKSASYNKKSNSKRNNRPRNRKPGNKPYTPEQPRLKEELKLTPVTSKNSLEERLAYYKQKYGEDFQPADKTEEPVPAEQS